MPSHVRKRILFKAAFEAGHQLFDSHRSGLEYFEDSMVEYHKFSEYPIEVDEDLLGTEDGYSVEPYVDDFEYQFFPSRLETNPDNIGKDVSNDLVRDLEPDVDGNIYLYHPECGIRVITVNE